MRRSIVRPLVLAIALAGPVAGCQTQQRPIPTLTLQAAMRLPPGQVPTVFKDPTNPYGYPYNIHETDGLSRNPDDCVIWGCIDVNRH